MGADAKPLEAADAGAIRRRGVLAEAVAGARIPTTRARRVDRGAAALEALATLARRRRLAGLEDVLETAEARRFLSPLLSASPHLARLTLGDPEFVGALATESFETLAGRILDAVAATDPGQSRDQLMRSLRRQRSRASVLLAAASAFEIRDARVVGRTLSDLADRSVSLATEHLLRHRVDRGELGAPPDGPSGRRWGYFLLAVGGHGARDLGFSSELALIALYDPDRVAYLGTREPGDCFVRATRDLIRILQARTGDGYAFRTDDRLRPGGPSAPQAISVDRALGHYRDSGRTWERATLIDARPVAGDFQAAADFLRRLRSFVWDDGLDFASVEDLGALSRQIRRHRSRPNARSGGLDLELAPGGIREIELLVRMHQLAYGGRDRRLRGSGVLATLAVVEQLHHLLPSDARSLGAAYRTLRRIRDAVQTVHDEPTRSLPRSSDALEDVACLANLESGDAVARAAAAATRSARALFEARFGGPARRRRVAASFADAAEDDGSRTRALAAAGFRDAAAAGDVLRRWVAGEPPALASARARDALLDALDEIVAAVAKTGDPDGALAGLDALFAALPADAAFFSTLRAHRWTLNLLALAMAESPWLAGALIRRPRILDAVVEPGFFLPIPKRDALRADLARRVEGVAEWDDLAAAVAVWMDERRFQIAVQTLQLLATAEEAGRRLADVADAAILTLLEAIETRSDGASADDEPADAPLSVLALGDFGRREATLESPLEILIAPGARAAPTDGRAGERLVRALEGWPQRVVARRAPGDLDESGDAPVRDRLELAQARVVAADAEVRAKLEARRRARLERFRDPGELARAVGTALPTAGTRADPPAPEGAAAGLADLHLIAQYLILTRLQRTDDPIPVHSVDRFRALAKVGALSAEEERALTSAFRTLKTVVAFADLTFGHHTPIDEAPKSMRDRLARALEREAIDDVAAVIGRSRTEARSILRDRAGV